MLLGYYLIYKSLDFNSKDSFECDALADLLGNCELVGGFDAVCLDSSRADLAAFRASLVCIYIDYDFKGVRYISSCLSIRANEMFNGAYLLFEQKDTCFNHLKCMYLQQDALPETTRPSEFLNNTS